MEEPESGEVKNSTSSPKRFMPRFARMARDLDAFYLVRRKSRALVDDVVQVIDMLCCS